MKAYATVVLLLALIVVGGCTRRTPPKSDNRTRISDLDLTTATTFQAEGLGGTQSLREFRATNRAGDSDNYIFGVYRNPMEWTRGHDFYVFPDGCFVIEAFVDIAEPITVASGKWKLQTNELVVFDLVVRTNASNRYRDVKDSFGRLDRLRLFVTTCGQYVEDTLLVAQDTVKQSTNIGFRYAQRIECYRDWSKEQRRLLTQ